MKHVQTLVFAAISGFVLMLAADAFAQSIHPGVVTVVRIVGEARYSLGDGIWHPLVAGKILTPGAVLQTGHDATVDVILGKKILLPQADPLPDRISMAEDPYVRGFVSYKPSVEQNAIRLTGDTVLAIDKLTVSDTGVDTVSDTELDLRQGRIYCSVKKLSGASQYLIKIPNGIAGVRGTLFVIDANGYVGVLRNSVVLSIIGPDGKPITVVVGEGSQFDPKSGLIAPLTADLTAALDQVITPLRTLYWGDVNFTFDRTQCRISPTQGYNPPPHGHPH
ncbi:MAG: FecR domain-containing protein [Limisphaerales bacterium]